MVTLFMTTLASMTYSLTWSDGVDTPLVGTSHSEQVGSLGPMVLGETRQENGKFETTVLTSKRILGTHPKKIYSNRISWQPF